MLVPFAQMVASNKAWKKQPTPPSSLAPYPARGCAEATTNFALLWLLPDAYEVIVGCPTAAGTGKLWREFNWDGLARAGWHRASSAAGSYGQASRSFVQHYVYDGNRDACWAYMTVLTVRNVFGITALCDADRKPLAQTRAEAATWTRTVVQRIRFVQRKAS